MFRVHCLLPRAEAERLSDILAEMDPSPASAVSVEEASRVAWSLDAFCVDEDLAKEAGLLPEGAATGNPSHPVAQNPKFWLYAAICVRHRWDEHSQVTRTEFDAAIAAVSVSLYCWYAMSTSSTRTLECAVKIAAM